MDSDRKPSEELRRWALGWRAAGAALAAQRAAELERLDTASALAQLADLFEHALRHGEPLLTSGLVEQQRLFQRLRP